MSLRWEGTVGGGGAELKASEILRRMGLDAFGAPLAPPRERHRTPSDGALAGRKGLSVEGLSLEEHLTPGDSGWKPDGGSEGDLGAWGQWQGPGCVEGSDVDSGSHCDVNGDEGLGDAGVGSWGEAAFGRLGGGEKVKPGQLQAEEGDIAGDDWRRNVVEGEGEGDSGWAVNAGRGGVMSPFAATRAAQEEESWSAGPGPGVECGDSGSAAGGSAPLPSLIGDGGLSAGDNEVRVCVDEFCICAHTHACDAREEWGGRGRERLSSLRSFSGRGYGGNILGGRQLRGWRGRGGIAGRGIASTAPQPASS